MSYAPLPSVLALLPSPSKSSDKTQSLDITILKLKIHPALGIVQGTVQGTLVLCKHRGWLDVLSLPSCAL